MCLFNSEYLCDFKTLSSNLTRSVRDRPDEGGQHLDSGRGIGVTAQPFPQLHTETGHDVSQCLIREAHGVQVLINLPQKQRMKATGLLIFIRCVQYKESIIFTQYYILMISSDVYRIILHYQT